MKTYNSLKKWVAAGAAILTLQSQAQFTDDYANASLWTRVGNMKSGSSNPNYWVDIKNNSLLFDKCGGKYETRWYRAHNLNLDYDWQLDIDFTPTYAVDDGPSQFIIMLTAGNQNPVSTSLYDPLSNQDAIGLHYVSINKTSDQSTFILFGVAKNDDNNFVQAPTGIQLNLNSNYYLRLQRLDATNCKLRVFSNPERTTLIGETCFTIPQGITNNLTYIQHSSVIYASIDRTFSATLDNLSITNNIINPGTISGNQTICAGIKPANIINTGLASTIG